MYVTEGDADADPPIYSLYVRNELHYRGPDLADLTGHAVWDLHALVHKHARDFVFLHAGAVARDGGALVLPAVMDSGKSTLVTALLESGWSYLSDELGAVDPVTGRIYPFPKLIGLDREALAFFPGLAELPQPPAPARPAELFLAPEDLGAANAPPSLPRWIVFPAADWEGTARLRPLTKAEAVERMARNSLNLYRYGERGVVLLSRVAADAPAFELSGGTPSERARVLGEELV